MKQPDVPRCGWAQASPLETAYHDSDGVCRRMTTPPVRNAPPGGRTDGSRPGNDPEQACRLSQRLRRYWPGTRGAFWRVRTGTAAGEPRYRAQPPEGWASIDTARAVPDIRPEQGPLAGVGRRFVDDRTLLNRGGKLAGYPCRDRRIPGAGQGAQAVWLPFRGSGHLLGVHAGRRYGERP